MPVHEPMPIRQHILVQFVFYALHLSPDHNQPHDNNYYLDGNDEPW